MTSQPKVHKPDRLPRGALDRETVVAAALEIADRDGLAGVTMARVAEALGGSPMSLYRHLHDKQELLDAVADLALSEVPAIAQDGRSWRARLEEFLLESRRGALRHPALVEIVLENSSSGPRAAAVGLDMIALLHEAGFDEDSSIRGFMALRNHIIGAMAWEVSRFRGGSEEFAHQSGRHVRARGHAGGLAAATLQRGAHRGPGGAVRVRDQPPSRRIRGRVAANPATGRSEAVIADTTDLYRRPTFVDLVSRSLQNYPDRVAFVTPGGGGLTYDELRRLIARIAGAMQDCRGEAGATAWPCSPRTGPRLSPR